MTHPFIRNLDPETINRLKALALSHDRSLNDEIVLVLKREAVRSANDARTLAGTIQASFGDRTFSDSSEIIREDRDR